MDALAVERAQELRRILVGVHRDARRGLRRLVQARGIRRADLDPGLERAGEIAHLDRRLVGLRQPAREGNALGVLEAIRENAGNQIFVTLRWMLCRLELERLIYAAVDIAQPDREMVDRRRQRHGLSACRMISARMKRPSKAPRPKPTRQSRSGTTPEMNPSEKPHSWAPGPSATQRKGTSSAMTIRTPSQD